jgi:enamine deaminase RidA (YjgF/YER057c/UK114 family)
MLEIDTPEARIERLGLVLPTPPTPQGSYVPGVVHAGLLHLSGQGPLRPDGVMATGKVGIDVSLEEAIHHAGLTGLALLSAARQVLGSLARIERVVSVFGMVNAAPDFADHPKVINGCSDMFIRIFGENGRHARAAVGMGSLPKHISVEISAIFAVRS